MPDEPTPIDWSLTTWDGSRREQLRRWSQLTMDEILEAQEEMADLATEIGGDAALAGRRDPDLSTSSADVDLAPHVIREDPPGKH